MDIDGKGLLGTLGVLCLAFFIAGAALANPLFYVVGGLVLVILVAAGLHGAKGGMRIRDIWR